MFVDTHCHLDLMSPGKKRCVDEDYKASWEFIESVVEKSCIVGVEKIVNVGVDLSTSRYSVELSRLSDSIFAGVGIHPCDCTSDWRSDFEQIRNLASNSSLSKIVAIGEIGLDFYHKPFFKARQIDCLKAHIELALELNLPVSVHIRDSVDESLCLLEEYRDNLRGVLHCFCHSVEVAHQVIEWGFLLGVGGSVTYPKNDDLRETLCQIPLKNIVLETDAPFLPPQQYRGKQNTPEYIPLIAEKLAEIRGISVKEVEDATTFAAEKLFGLSNAFV